MGAPQHHQAVLVHLASGIGNIVLATPLLMTLSRQGYAVDLLVDGDYAETAALFRGWSALRAVYNGKANERPGGDYCVRIPAIPPFYWNRYARHYRNATNSLARPPDALFYRDEQAYYLEFARSLGCDLDQGLSYSFPAPRDQTQGITAATLVLAPGCKTGEMAAKRWPHFPSLAERFADVVVVGTPDDLSHFRGAQMHFPGHVRSLVGCLSLVQVAGVLAAAGVVVANDSGLGHVAGAVGAPTVLLFGPTSDRALGRLPGNVTVLRTGLPCEPCWFSQRFSRCAGNIDCLDRLAVEDVVNAVMTAGNVPLRSQTPLGPSAISFPSATPGAPF
jgi:ADP-heptose:LPS heptosyltransferase